MVAALRKRLVLLVGGFLLVAALASAHAADPMPLAAPGTDDFIDYTRFGTFENVGTPAYRYRIDDRPGLSQAVGEGIYPNETALLSDPAYRRDLRQKRLEGPLDHFEPDADPLLSFHKWASLRGTPQQGLRLYNIGRSFELGGRPLEAAKAYYAAVIHFPKDVVWQDARPWYVGVAALDAVERLTRDHPEWGRHLVGASIEIENGFDKKATNDVFKISPGRWESGPSVQGPEELGGIHQDRFNGDVRLVERDNGHWQLLVKDQPYLIRGMVYSPTPVGRSPDFDGYKPHLDWMNADENNNGAVDGPYDAWVDANGNNRQDPGEDAVGDFRLMADMGVNTIRLYHHAENKAILRDLAARYGIRVMMGDLLGAYAVGSGATWEEGTDYSNMAQREAMRQSVKEMVLSHKNEEYVLMWVLGNENNYGHGNNADKNPVAFYRFANSMARMIHIMDPSRPVALSNGDIENLDIIARECPAVDVLAINAYRGPNGMGDSFWKALRDIWKKPVVIGEFGCPAKDALVSDDQAAQGQADYLAANWKDIEGNSAGYGSGNALGGVVFEWVDEWWKSGPSYEPSVHDEEPQSKGPFPGGEMYEEWLGVTSQGDGQSSPYLRQLRPAYARFKNGPWKEPMPFPTHRDAWGPDAGRDRDN